MTKAIALGHTARVLTFPLLGREIEKSGWSITRLQGVDTELLSLKGHAESQFNEGRFSSAGVGVHRDKFEGVRGDKIAWIEPSMEGLPFLKNLIEQIQSELGQYFRCHIECFEGHLSHYPPGAYYHSHLDHSSDARSKTRDRLFSVILYLNESWQPGDGGELRLRLDHQTVDIEPRLGNLVVFRSDTIHHEVLETRAHRWTVSGWFRRK